MVRGFDRCTGGEPVVVFPRFGRPRGGCVSFSLTLLSWLFDFPLFFFLLLQVGETKGRSAKDRPSFSSRATEPAWPAPPGAKMPIGFGFRLEVSLDLSHLRLYSVVVVALAAFGPRADSL